MGWPELLGRARDQHGVVSLADARSCRVSAATLRDRAGREAWLPLHPGVWLLPSAPDTRAARHVAAILRVPGVFRERSALFVAGTGMAAPHPPELLLPHALRSRTLAGVDVRRTRHLPEDDLVEIAGHPATTAARAVVDLARRWSVDRLRPLVIDLERDGHLGRDELAACLTRTPRSLPGRGRVRLVLDDLGWLRSDSDTEHDVRRRLTELGYPVHPTPFPFRCDDGVVVHLDLALPSRWVYLEVDGRATHAGRGAFEADRRKWTQVVRHWRPVWVTHDRWRTDQRGVLQDLDEALALADPTRAPAEPAVPATS